MFKFLFILLIVFTTLLGQKAKIEEIQTGYIFQIMKYINWPNLSNGSFQIGIVGETEIFNLLEEISKKRKINKMDIKVKKFKSVEEIEICNVLFITNSFENKIQEIKNLVKNKKVLLIGNSEGLSYEHTAINFVIVNSKVLYEINEKEILRNGLEVNKQLIDWAYKRY